ncbi:MAG: hypothetical protein KF764_23755 [Labilithrix sp.]|nr:hypothetical protein [Labilithrix sp.]
MTIWNNDKRTSTFLFGASILMLLAVASTGVACGTEDCAESASCGASGTDVDASADASAGGSDAEALDRGIRLSIVSPKSPEPVVQGEALALTLGVERRPGSQGEIELALTGLPSGATSGALSAVASGATQGAVTIQTAPTTPQGRATITITATHAADGERSEVKLELQVRGRPGARDTSFGDAGVTRTLFSSPGLIGTGALHDVMGLPDGRVLVGGRRVNNATVARLSATGKLDTGFGGAGFASLLVSQGFLRLAPTPTGTSTYALVGPGGGVGALFLLDQAGAAVTSFNGTGRRDVDVGPSPFGAHQLAVLPDGKVLVLSRYNTMAGGQGLGITRYKPDGALDVSYGADPPGLCSITVAGTGGTMLYPGNLLVAPDGSARVHAPSTPAAFSSFVKGCTPSGAVDTAVGAAPNHVQTGIANGRAVRAPSGELIVASESSWSRYNAGGAVDTSIGALGTVALPSGVNASAVLVQDDFKVVVGGSEGRAFKVFRYLPNGVLDPDFGEDGVVTLDVADENGMASLDALAFQTGGRLLVGGTRFDDDATDVVVVRLWR